MGKKAKKRKQRLEEVRTSELHDHDENEAWDKAREFIADQDYDLLYMDPSIPIWLFSNKKTREFTTIGRRHAVMGMSAALDRAMEEVLQKKANKASLN